MLIKEGIVDALRHLDIRFKFLVISREKEKNDDCTELEMSWGLFY